MYLVSLADMIEVYTLNIIMTQKTRKLIQQKVERTLKMKNEMIHCAPPMGHSGSMLGAQWIKRNKSMRNGFPATQKGFYLSKNDQ